MKSLIDTPEIRDVPTPHESATRSSRAKHLPRDAEQQPASANRLTLRKPDELLAMKFDESDRILGDRLLAKGQSLVIAGAGAIGKSRLLLQLAVATISGRPFVGLETRQPELRWLILQAENSNRRLQTDLAALREWTGPKVWPRVNEQIAIHTLETESDGFLSLDNPETQRRVASLIAEFQPDVIAFDSLYNFTAGDLNADVDMRETLTAISRLSKTGNPERAIVVLHHALTGRAGASRSTGFDRASFGRNSKVLHSWARGQINLAPGTAETNDTLVLSCGKCANGKEFAPFAIRLNSQSMVYECAPDFDLAGWQGEVTGRTDRTPLMTLERVRELCKGTVAKAELAKSIMEDCGCYRGSAYRYVARAVGRTIRHNKSNDTYSPK